MSSKAKKRNDVTTEIVVGAFMFIILVVLLTVSIVISQNKFFEKSYHLSAMFQNIGGLKEGEPIFLRGVKVGYVENIRIPEEGTGVNVRMKFTRKITLYSDYEIYVEASSMLGGMRLVVDEGSPQFDVLTEEEMDALVGEPAKDVLREAAKVVEMIRSSLVDDGTLDSINVMVENLADITGKISNGEGTVGRLVQDDALYEETMGLMGQLGDAAEDIQKVAKDAKVISTRLVEGKGSMGKFLSEDEAAYNDLAKILKEMSAASEDVRIVMDRVQKGQGVIGKLLSEDDQLYNDLRDTVASLKEVSNALAKESGTMGLLINDDALYLKVTALVDEARATVDDFRETSPITTFSSIFFGAF
ncbi:MlaD family protein [Kiritimatiellota bacterium B12222]|nr:MlaD family protein [Kiritimatiellota bacterium B12222]